MPSGILIASQAVVLLLILFHEVEVKMENDNFQFRAVVKFLVKEDYNATQIHQRLVNIYQESALAYSTVGKWTAEFKRVRESLEDDPRSGRPADVITPEMCLKVEKLLFTDRRIKVHQIEEELGISHGSIITILHEKSGLSKVSAQSDPPNAHTLKQGDPSGVESTIT